MSNIPKQKEAKLSLPNDCYIDGIDGDAIYKKLNTSGHREIRDFVLDAAIVREKLNQAIDEAKSLYKDSSDRLGLGIDVEKFMPSMRDSVEVKERLMEVYKDPTKRQLVGAYISSKEALSSLCWKATKLRIFDSMTQLDLFELLDAFKDLGVARYCIFDKHLQEDMQEIKEVGELVGEERGKKQGVRDNLEVARKGRNMPANMMRDEANRLYAEGKFTSKNSAKHALKPLLIDFGNKPEVGFTFKADNIEQTIYDWLLYPNGKPKKKKSTK